MNSEKIRKTDHDNAKKMACLLAFDLLKKNDQTTKQNKSKMIDGEKVQKFVSQENQRITF